MAHLCVSAVRPYRMSFIILDTLLGGICERKWDYFSVAETTDTHRWTLI
ncbi:MAG: hypothetical protein QME51_05505 [Planctomycetota bacterium]|nr:hypothetical protein [Planctomycetota bacterium]